MVFNGQSEAYHAEVKERWGDTDAYKEYAERTKHDAAQKRDALAKETDSLMAAFAVCMQKGEAPDSAAAQSLVKNLQQHITEQYYRCTNDILAGLGQMYAEDERFRHNIDRHGEGTAVFICEAIQVYCGK